MRMRVLQVLLIDFNIILQMFITLWKILYNILCYEKFAFNITTTLNGWPIPEFFSPKPSLDQEEFSLRIPSQSSKLL